MEQSQDYKNHQENSSHFLLKYLFVYSNDALSNHLVYKKYIKEAEENGHREKERERERDREKERQRERQREM